MTAAPALPASAPVEEDRVKPGGWYTFGFLLAATLFAFVDRQIITLLAPAFSADLALSDAQLGLVLGLAFALFTVAAVYPIAWAADRFGRRTMFGVCIVTWSLGTAACGLAQNFTQMFVAVMAIAAGEAGLVPIGAAAIPDLFSGRKRVLANSLNYIFAYAGVSLGLMLGGAAITQLTAYHPQLPDALQAWSAWRVAFFLAALPGPLFLLFLPFAKLGSPDARVAATTTAADARLLPFLRQQARPIVLLLAALGSYLLAFGGFLAWLPTLASRLFGTSPAQVGLYMGVASGVSTALGVTTATLMMRRHMRRGKASSVSVRVAWMTSAAIVPALLLFPLAAADWQLFTLFAVLMVSGTAIGSLVYTILQDMAPAPLRTRFFAIYTICAGLIGGSAPSLTGAVSSALGGTPKDLLNALILVALPCWIVSILLFRAAEKPYGQLVLYVRAIDQSL